MKGNSLSKAIFVSLLLHKNIIWRGLMIIFVHDAKKLYKCNICGANFARDESVQDEQKPLKCNICDSKFAQNCRNTKIEKPFSAMFVMLHLYQNIRWTATFNQFTEVRFPSFFSCGFTIMTLINPPEKKLAKCTSVQFMAPL